jgi:DNA-binding SARP family transcriptional activator
MFRLKLLGGALIEGPAGLLSGRSTQRRRVALLACLAAANGRPVSRDKLMALLWPDADSEHARHLLSDSIYLIRKELGEAALVSAGQDIRLDDSRVSSDVLEFGQALLQGRLEQAVALYAGPFLDGFHIDDAPEFEHWLDTERERLSRSYARALESLAQERESARDFNGAAEWWRQLAAHEPTNGRVAMRVMQALDAAGDRAGAIQHARAHTLILREQFGIDPDPEVNTLANHLRVAPPPNSSRRPSPDATSHVVVPGPASPPTTTTTDTIVAVAAVASAHSSPSTEPAIRSWRRPRRVALLTLVATAATLTVGSLLRPSGERDVILVADVAGDTAPGDFVSERLRRCWLQRRV